MSIQVANIDLSAAVVGTTGAIKFGQATPPPTITQQMRPQSAPGYTLLIQNESGCGLTCTFPATQKSLSIRAGDGRIIHVPPGEAELDYVVFNVLPNAPISRLLADLYIPGEAVDSIGNLGNSPIGLSQAVSALSTKIPINTTGGNITGIEFGPDPHSLSDWEFLLLSNGDWVLWDNKNGRNVLEAMLSNGHMLFGFPVKVNVDTTGGNTAAIEMLDAHSLSDWELLCLPGGDLVIWDNKNSRNVMEFVLSSGNVLAGQGLSTGGNLVVGTDIAQINGQATAGSFGVAPIVAQTINTNVTVTTLQTILTTTIPATGLYRIGGSFFGHPAGSPYQPLITMTYTGGNTVGTNTLSFIGPGAAPTDGAHSFTTTVDFPLCAYELYLKTGTSLTCQYQDTATSPNDFITFFVERLS